MTRRRWLQRGAAAMRPWLAALGLPVRGRIPVRLAVPDLRARRERVRSAVGYMEHLSDPARFEITLDDDLRPIQALGTVLHELIHAAAPEAHHDEAPFTTLAAGLGFRQPLGDAVPGPALRRRLSALSGALGPYPPPPRRRRPPKTA